MKKNVILLLIFLQIPLWSFSQTTYPNLLNDSLVVITTNQLKTTNLIFLEHSYLKETNSILFNEVECLNQVNSNLEYINILNESEIEKYKDLTENFNKEIESYNKKIYRLKWVVGGLTITTGALAAILIIIWQ